MLIIRCSVFHAISINDIAATSFLGELFSTSLARGHSNSNF